MRAVGRVEERPLSTGVRKGELRDSRAPGWRLSMIDDRHDFAFLWTADRRKSSVLGGGGRPC